MSSLLLAALAPIASAQTVPAGGNIQEAAAVQVTPAGLDALGGLLPAVVPPETEVDGIDEGFTCLNVQIEGLKIGLAIANVEFVPEPGRLLVDVDLLVNVNDAADPFTVSGEVVCLDMNCPTYVRPFPVSAQIPFELGVAVDPNTQDRYFDATLGEMVVDLGLDNTHIELSGSCNTIDDLDDLLGAVNLSFFDFIINTAEPFVLDILAQQASTIEETLDDALRDVRFEDSFEVGDVTLDVLVEPWSAIITPAGIDLALQGRFDAPVHECVAEHDPGGSLLTDSNVPSISANPSGTEIIIHASDELANQGLYAIWRSGLFCYEISEDSELDIGIPINSSLLGVLGGEGFDALIPETKPLAIETDPRAAPTVDYAADHDLVVLVRELGVDFYSEVDFRQTRALGLTIESDVGVDLLFDGQTGELAADVALSGDNIFAFATHNELVPESSEQIQESFTGLVDVLLDSLVGDLLDDIRFSVPSFEGQGLQTLSARASGGRDWLGLSATAGPVPYGSSGGGCDGGCSGSAGSSCDQSGAPVAPFAGLIALIALRRRNRAS